MTKNRKHTSIQKTNEYISKRSVIKIINHAKNEKQSTVPPNITHVK